MKQAAERDAATPPVGTGTPRVGGCSGSCEREAGGWLGSELASKNAAELAEGVEDWLQPCKCTS